MFIFDVSSLDEFYDELPTIFKCVRTEAQKIVSGYLLDGAVSEYDRRSIGRHSEDDHLTPFEFAYAGAAVSVTNAVDTGFPHSCATGTQLHIAKSNGVVCGVVSSAQHRILTCFADLPFVKRVTLAEYRELVGGVAPQCFFLVDIIDETEIPVTMEDYGHPLPDFETRLHNLATDVTMIECRYIFGLKDESEAWKFSMQDERYPPLLEESKKRYRKKLDKNLTFEKLHQR